MSDLTVSPTREGAARKLARLLASDAGRRLFARNDYVAGTPVIPASADESIASVMTRVAATGVDRTVLAVHFPDRTGDEELIVFDLTRTTSPRFSTLDTGRGASSIGMLADSMRGKSGSFSVAAEAVLHRFDPVAA